MTTPHMHGEEGLIEKREPPSSSSTKWLLVTYRPISLFSLRTVYATSKGGKTLLIPTPYAVKMALLDACYRAFSNKQDADREAINVFEQIKSSAIRFSPPEHCVVQNTFLKILEPPTDEQKERKPFKSTVAYREFIYYRGELTIAIEATRWDEKTLRQIRDLFMRINYFGKRGSFWQFVGDKEHDGELPYIYTVLHEEIRSGRISGVSASSWLTQPLDDFGPDLCSAPDGFEKVNTFAAKNTRFRLNRERAIPLVCIPYKRVSAERHFTWYRCTTEE